MLRWKKILVPIDVSDESMQALSVAQSLARDHSASLVLVTAAPPPPQLMEPFLPGTEYPGILDELRRQLEATSARVQNLSVETHVLGGEPGAAIVALANDCDADLIVMETHGRSGLSRMLMGSVAEYVLRHARCPVLTMMPGTSQHLQSDSPTSAARSVS